MHKYILLLTLLVCGVSVAQTETLTYEKAIELALQNNFEILIARNNQEITQIQNNWGNAGALPKFDINAGASTANNATRQEFSNGISVNKTGVQSSNINAGAYLNWTIFDGMKMFATKNRLAILESQGELSCKIQLENTIEQVTLLYYQWVKQLQLIKGVKASMKVTEERIKVAEKRLNVGNGSQLELLQAKMDYNAQKSNVLNQEVLLLEYKNQLYAVLKVNLEQSYSVDTTFTFKEVKPQATIQENLETQNTSILFAKKNYLISQQVMREYRSQQMPRIGVTGNYLFAKNQNAAGFSLLNQNLGLNLGMTFSWNLYNGSITRNQIKVAGLQMENATLQIDNTKTIVNAKINSAYIRYLNDLELVKLETENSVLAEQSLKIASEKVKAGIGNYLEIRESQNTYEAALVRLVSARYNLKVSETTLKKISGELIQ